MKNDIATKGFGWALATTFLGFTAAKSSDPFIKFLAAIGAIATGTQAVRCFEITARQSYQQLTSSQLIVPMV